MNRIVLRNGTSSEWITHDPVLYEGEIGIETDTNKFKIGNGVDKWTQLSYSGAPLYDALDSSSTTEALTAAQGRQLNLAKVAKTGDNMTGNLGIYVATPSDALDIEGNIRIRKEKSMKFGGSMANDSVFEIVYNSSTNSLDFNYLL